LSSKIKDLTVEELKSLISETVKETLEDIVEDLIALSSDSYIQSIKEARENYREGKVVNFKDLFDV